MPEVATCTATNSDYATCGLKRESCRAEKKHPHFPITLAYRKCKQQRTGMGKKQEASPSTSELGFTKNNAYHLLRYD